jgi:molecular chaperone DnaK
LVFETEKGLREYGDRLDSDTKAKVQAAVARAKEAQKTDNLDEIKSATEALTAVWHQAAGKMYQQSQAGAGAQQTAGTTDKSGHAEGEKGGAGEAVDADYEVVG